MKYSRDMSGQVLDNPVAFDAMIDKQMVLIKDAGATHVAIDTPYDAKFIPVLTRWVNSARRHGLSVWFRGNFSGWEGWFDYSSIERAEHERLLSLFIRNNPTLFVNGDVFTPCPECENGGAGDPRQTGDSDGYNGFLVEEYKISNREFAKIGKSVKVYTSMNGDIARDIITPDTARDLGGSILIDHYVGSVSRFSSDVASISRKQNAQVGLGEFGAPIPDLNGNMTPPQQASLVSSLLNVLYDQSNHVPLVNYWDLSGGSTALLNDDGTPRPAYYAVRNYFRAPSVYGSITDSLGEPLDGVKISVASTSYSTITDSSFYQIFFPTSNRTIIITKEGYSPLSIPFSKDFTLPIKYNISLQPTSPTKWYELKKFYYDFVMSLR